MRSASLTTMMAVAVLLHGSGQAASSAEAAGAAEATEVTRAADTAGAADTTGVAGAAEAARPVETAGATGEGEVTLPEGSSALPPEGSSALPPPPYQSPKRDDCEAELAEDPGWQADLRDQFATRIRSEDADEFVRNKRHLIMAYAAIWILTVGFLVILWRRQRGFAAEIERLRAELERAMRARRE